MFPGKPTLRKTAWQVWTSNEIYAVDMDAPMWLWVAYGPRGSECGAEQTSGAATNKAQAAAWLLRDEPR
jgi:hypothetical protein